VESTERLAQAIDRAHRLHSYAPQLEAEQRGLSSLAQTPPAPFQQPLRYVVGRKRDRFALLIPADICFFRAADGLARAHTKDETYWVNYQLNQLEAGLPSEMFFRAHRSALVCHRRSRSRRWLKDG
jgi:DNA-binding LytR/AlgR family response regulator